MIQTVKTNVNNPQLFHKLSTWYNGSNLVDPSTISKKTSDFSKKSDVYTITNKLRNIT